jgi:hypothetical protein
MVMREPETVTDSTLFSVGCCACALGLNRVNMAVAEQPA